VRQNTVMSTKGECAVCRQQSLLFSKYPLCLKIPKGLSESVNRRTDNTMPKEKGPTTVNSIFKQNILLRKVLMRF
jgi:hypothetical protein